MLMKEYRICMPLTVDEQTANLDKKVCPHAFLYHRNCLELLPLHCNSSDSCSLLWAQHNHLTLSFSCFSLSLLCSFQKCSFLPRFHVKIETHFENDNGCDENVFGGDPTPKDSVCFLDILSDPIPDKHYKKSEDLSNWVSQKTGRGPLVDGWRNATKPIMCSYKRVTCSFEVYGFQGRTEDFIHRNIRDILLVGHRQAVAWIDEWHGMTLEQVREYERKQQEETNSKLKSDITCTDSAPPVRPGLTRSISVTDESSLKKMGVETVDMPSPSSLKYPMRLNSTPE
ncbi:hypothetical protein cypCar_00019919 [Cyprinus carpio]|nr:hypothetical protein cypCar_00019919 [Cyprinus carpio]